MEKKAIFNSTIISTYCLFLSVAYLWGFWGHFDINILNYIGVSDIIKSAVWPMIIATIMYFIQVALNIFNGPKSNPAVKFADMPKSEKIEHVIGYSYMILMLGIVVFGGIYALITGSKMVKYAVFGWILSIVLCYVISKNKELMEHFPSKNKALACGIICFLPSIFLSRGVSEGERIISGKDTYLVESNALCPNSANNRYRYIDVLADKAFAISINDGSICIFKFEYLKLVKENTPQPIK
ncbi:hypothetical protein PU850_003520 [Cronobacter dublinensis]|nr:hypothetical protein [Cronobacter dublinensis]